MLGLNYRKTMVRMGNIDPDGWKERVYRHRLIK
jgi:hypothetical protein